jgi:hypothetical protein
MDDFAKIVVLDDEVQAELVDALLDERGVPHVLKSYHDSMLDGLFQGQAGWGHVEAPESRRDEVLAAVRDVEGRAS